MSYRIPFPEPKFTPPTLKLTSAPSSNLNTPFASVTPFCTPDSKDKPDILLVLGDRYDMLPAVVAALPFRIPIAHGQSPQGSVNMG